MINSGFFLDGVPRPRLGTVLCAEVGSVAPSGVFAIPVVHRHAPQTPSAVATAFVAQAGWGPAVGGAAEMLVGTPVHQPVNRKPYIYMTRVNASGDGASGPHPEREPA